MSAIERQARQILGDGGVVIGTAEYVSGKLDGVSRLYSSNGALVQEVRYSDGQLHGEYRTWWDTGRPKEQGHYVRGQRQGVYSWYGLDGALIQTHDYGTAL